ncbi:MAG: hypothetical protein ACPW61_10460 [Methyloligella sp. ZOD6]
MSEETQSELFQNPLKNAFLRWQCRVRQIVMRENGGRPDDAIMPLLTPKGEDQPIGQVITVMPRSPEASVTPELMHMARKTMDPAQRREQALTFFSANYYQKPEEFAAMLTATFQPDSAALARVRAAQHCTLTFQAYSRRFDLSCTIRRLDRSDPLREATWWHNFLFNPNLDADTEVIGFEPSWSESRAHPPL